MRRTTTRLWSWRSEDGPIRECAERVGRATAAAGPAGVWPLLAGWRLPRQRLSRDGFLSRTDVHSRAGTLLSTPTLILLVGVYMPDVLVERRGDAAWLTLNRPERFNAYDLRMAHELRQCVDDARDAGVIVITGAGRAFCAGGYLADIANISEDAMRMLYRASLELFEAIRLSPRPVIAAVNGAAAGGGNELVVACDIAIAADTATLGQTGVRVGSSPVLGGANMLAMAVGEKRAKEVAFLCRRYKAAEALEMGWVNAVVPAESLVAEVDRWGAELLAMSPRYLEITKSISNVWWNAARDSYLQGVGMLTQSIGSHDMIEGARAFMEKRKPVWEGRPLRAADGASADGASADGASSGGSRSGR